MNFGFSNAEIRIIKRGDYVREQGILCSHIGPEVAPRIYAFHDDGYEMEILEHPSSRSRIELRTMHEKLFRFVWNRPPAYQNTGWLRLLLSWAQESPWLLKSIQQFYPVEPTDGYSLIHGDPTLANLMIRDGCEPIITDPMPRTTNRLEMPDRSEVDLGKLLQSALGWEYEMGCKTAIRDSPDVVLNEMNLNTRGRRGAMLWCAIHTARLGRKYKIARDKISRVDHGKLCRWGEEQSKIMTYRLERDVEQWG